LSRIISEPNANPARAGRIQSVERALRMLRAFATPGQQLTVGALARHLGVHKSTASRLAATLVAAGFLERGGDDDQLALGPELLRLGRLAASGRSLPEAARPVMDELAAETGETVTLSVAEAHGALTIAQSEGSFAVGLQGWLHRTSPLHATSDGKVLLAFGAATLPEGELEATSLDTITDRTALDAELAQVRARGWGSARGDFELGLNGVAAPIFAPGAVCRAALCISGPAYRIPEQDFPVLGARCATAAARIAAVLDFPAADTGDV
jgi:DNA-binding IclR family transcriptional regulator